MPYGDQGVLLQQGSGDHGAPGAGIDERELRPSSKSRKSGVAGAQGSSTEREWGSVYAGRQLSVGGLLKIPPLVIVPPT